MYIKKDTLLPSFIPIPRFLMKMKCSINAKLLYGLLLNRTMLSQKSDWISDEGNVYVIYTIKEMAIDLGRSERTINSALDELEKADLLTRIHQGWNRANRIFLKLPDSTQDSSSPDGNICALDTQKTSCCSTQNLPTSNTDYEYKDLNKDTGERTLCLGPYQNVFLTESQHAALISDYPGQYEDYINRLSTYMASSGRHYANHDAVIRKWLNEDRRSKKTKNHDYDDSNDKGDCL